MAYTDTIVNNLVINKMTQAQYNALSQKSDTELYLVPDNYDTVPTNNSDNPITSGGVYTALGEKQDIIDSSHKLNADYIVDGTTNKVINKIESVEVNGVALTPDANKSVNVQVPTNTNQLVNGAGYITSADIAGKEDNVAIITPELDNNNAFNASVGNYYKVTGNASAIDITLVTPSETSHLSSCIFLIDNSVGVGVSFHTQNLPFYQAANFAIATGKVYEVNALFNGTAWYLTQVEMEVQP